MSEQCGGPDISLGRLGIEPSIHACDCVLDSSLLMLTAVLTAIHVQNVFLLQISLIQVSV